MRSDQTREQTWIRWRQVLGSLCSKASWNPSWCGIEHYLNNISPFKTYPEGMTGDTTEKVDQGIYDEAFVNTFNIFFMLAPPSIAVLGIKTSCVGLKMAYAIRPKSSFSCAPPVCNWPGGGRGGDAATLCYIYFCGLRAACLQPQETCFLVGGFQHTVHLRDFYVWGFKSPSTKRTVPQEDRLHKTSPITWCNMAAISFAFRVFIPFYFSTPSQS